MSTIITLLETAATFGREYWIAILVSLLAILTLCGTFMKYWFKPGSMNYLKFIWYYRQLPVRHNFRAQKMQLVLIEHVLEELATDYNSADITEQQITQPYGVGRDRSLLNPRRDMKALRRAQVRVYRSKNAYWNAHNAAGALGYEKKLKKTYREYVRGYVAAPAIPAIAEL